MKWSARTTDRSAAMAIYLMLCAMALWAGTALINYSIANKFYKDYLIAWRLAGERYINKETPWPVFTGTNHAQYMEQLVRAMESRGIYPPKSNTEKPYTYVLDRLWKKEEHIFILLLPEKMIVYGMSQQTYGKVDKYVDGLFDMKRGAFRGKISKDRSTIIGIWGMS